MICEFLSASARIFALMSVSTVWEVMAGATATASPASTAMNVFFMMGEY